MSDDNYRTDIREVEPTYKHTLGRDAGREVDEGATVHLSTVTVTVKIEETGGRDRTRETYSCVFAADHDNDVLEWRSIGDAFEKQTSFTPAMLLTAAGIAEDAVAEYAETTDMEYTVGAIETPDTPAAKLFAALEVSDR